MQKLFGIDTRTLALIRISAGLCIVAQMIMIYPYRWPFFDEKGVMPHSDVYEHAMWSLYFINGSAQFAAALMIITGILGALFVIGFRSRLVALLLWVLMASFEQRIYWIHNGGEWYLPQILLWLTMLPIGAKWSVDALLSPGTPKEPQKITSIAGMGLMAQVTCMYLFSGLLKVPCYEWLDGSAVHTVLNSFDIRGFGAPYVAGYYPLMQFLTIYVVYLEALAVIGLFFPWKTPIIRSLTLIQLIAMHAGFVFLLEIGAFPFICITGLLVFIPSEIWDSKYGTKAVAAAHRLLAPALPFIQHKLTPALARLERNMGLTRHSMFAPLGVVRKAFCLMCMILVVMWNTYTVETDPWYHLSTDTQKLVYSLRLRQRMGFFAPPWNTTTFVVIEGERNDGSRVNLLFEREGKPSYNEGQYSGEMYPTHRWRTILREDLRGKDEYTIGRYFCEVFPIKVNPAIGRDLRYVWLTAFFRATTLPGETPGTTNIYHQFSYDCNTGEVKRYVDGKYKSVVFKDPNIQPAAEE